MSFVFGLGTRQLDIAEWQEIVETLALTANFQRSGAYLQKKSSRFLVQKLPKSLCLEQSRQEAVCNASRPYFKTRVMLCMYQKKFENSHDLRDIEATQFSHHKRLVDLSQALGCTLFELWEQIFLSSNNHLNVPFRLSRRLGSSSYEAFGDFAVVEAV